VPGAALYIHTVQRGLSWAYSKEIATSTTAENASTGAVMSLTEITRYASEVAELGYAGEWMRILDACDRRRR